MYILIPKGFVVSVNQIDIEDIVMGEKYEYEVNEGYIARESTGVKNDEIVENSVNYEVISASVEDVFREALIKIGEIAGELNTEDFVKVFQAIVAEILKMDVQTIPCFAVIKEKPVNGMNLEEATKMHLDELTQIINKHLESFGCLDKNDSVKPLSQDDLDSKIADIKEVIDITFGQLEEITKDLSIAQMVPLHQKMFRLIREFLINSIPCIKDAAAKMNLEEVNKIHDEKIAEAFRTHVKIFGCK